ncbi:MAG: hypothetical protein KatS3mg113_0744 [Planctomycetaceae bacterium]|nr:MAG: hypothetical protein KatS3mg113_0744 [Planctomycetaceae bacterium]
MKSWQSSILNSKTLGCLLLGLNALVIAGCRREEQIHQYVIPKLSSIQLPAPGQQEKTDQDQSAKRPERLLGAIISPPGEQTWFFKLSGSPERVEPQVQRFETFIRSIRFVNGEPVWIAPPEWSQQPASGMRFASFRVDHEQPVLELTVIPLPRFEGDAEQQLLANINRWRGQLSLPPLQPEELKTEVRPIELEGGLLAYFVDFTGQSANASTPQMFRTNRTLSPQAMRGENGTPGNLLGTPPAHWRPGRVGGMRKAAYTLVDEDQGLSGEVTVIDLAREGGDRVANVNRWREQVGLPAASAEEIQKSLKPITVDGLTGDYVQLHGNNGQSIFGVIVDRENRTWFFKLQAPQRLAEREAQAFESYIRSVVWEN